MSADAREEPEVTVDTSDLDRWVGVELGGKTQKDPVAANDIRRWVQGMQNPNPLFYDEEYAAAGRFGKLVAPASFAVCTDDSHGAAPSIQGTIPGSHMLFGGDEWWFYGPRMEPGDRITRDRNLHDYVVKQTKFAGPTIFARGDTVYLNQRGEQVCKQRSTSIRYLAEEAAKRAKQQDHAPEPEWTDDELEAFLERKLDYYRTFRALGHDRRLGVRVGDALPERLIGPHSIATFTSEWRAFTVNVWGAFSIDDGPTSLRQAGWLKDMDKNLERMKIDPTQDDGLYHGPSRGHVNDRYAQRIGMPRAYGYGASMGAWILDYVSNWAGEWSDIVHSKNGFRAPALAGDITLLHGEVVSLGDEDEAGRPLAAIEVRMSNQRDEVLATGTVDVRLPTETSPA